MLVAKLHSDLFDLPPPEDEGGMEGSIEQVHSSNTAAKSGIAATETPALNGPQAVAPRGNAPGDMAGTRRIAQSAASRDPIIHGGNDVPTTFVGFLGTGPFWTVGSTPSRARPARPGDRDEVVAHYNAFTTTGSKVDPATSAHGPGAPAAIAAKGVATVTALAASAPDISGKINSAIQGCIDLLARAIDVQATPEPPEEELTMVAMETVEQRLQWREFLSDSVSNRCANTLYLSYDVDSEPPLYPRPPPSQHRKDVDKAGDDLTPRMPHMPHVVAPNGAGWAWPACDQSLEAEADETRLDTALEGTSSSSSSSGMSRSVGRCSGSVQDGDRTAWSREDNPLMQVPMAAKLCHSYGKSRGLHEDAHRVSDARSASSKRGWQAGTSLPDRANGSASSAEGDAARRKGRGADVGLEVSAAGGSVDEQPARQRSHPKGCDETPQDPGDRGVVEGTQEANVKTLRLSPTVGAECKNDSPAPAATAEHEA